MQVTVGDTDGIKTVRLEGELDARSAPEVREALVGLIEPEGRLLLDMSKVSYMSSAGLRVLLLVYRQAADGEARAVLVGLSEELAATMRITGFLDFFATAADFDEGVRYLRG